jgi:hypothetical protein
MKKQNIGMFAYFSFILLLSAHFSPSIDIPQARTQTGESSIQSGSDGRMLWNRTYGGPGFEWGSSVQVLGDGGYIIAGTTESYGAGELDFYLVRTDSEGNMLWNRTYGGSGFEQCSSVQVTDDGGFIIAGSTDSFGADADVYLVMTDSEGNMLWNRTYGGSDGDGGGSVQETSDGGYIITGYTYSFGAGRGDVYLVKTDSEGNMLWNRTYGGPNADYGKSVHQTRDLGYIIVGDSAEEGTFKYESYLVKTDSEGRMLWNRTYGGPKSYRGRSVHETSDGSYIICGDVDPLRAIGYTNVYLFKTDSEGNILWNRTYGGPRADVGSLALKTGDGGYVIVSSTNSFKTFDDMDVYLVKTDSEGNILWNRTYGGSEGEANFGHSVQETGDGGYIIAGEMAPPYMDLDLYLVKVTPFSVPSSITCQVSANTTKLGDAVNVSGKVTPSTLHRDITLTYTLPDGTTVTRTVKTDTDSVFLDEYAPDTPGSWEVTASMEGDAYYEASTSEPVAFTVEKPKGGVPLYTYGLMVVVAIAILASWLLLRRR